MIEYIQKGGPHIMIPLITLSVIAFAFIFERLWRFSRVPRGEKAEGILRELEKRIQTGEDRRAVEYCENHRNLLTHVALQIMERFDFLVREKRTISEMREELSVTAEESTRAYLEEYVPVIFTVSTVSPLLGLLGTITGMIKSFGAIAQKGVGDPQAVAGGISEALITTATGLIIAIPCVLAYNYFRRRIEKIWMQVEPFEYRFVNILLRDLARFRTYREMLKTAYRDGVLNDEEREFLKRKRIELNIADHEAEELEKEVKAELGWA